MSFIPIISTCKCVMCGEIASCARTESDAHVCRACNPINWDAAAVIEKESWISGNIEVTDA